MNENQEVGRSIQSEVYFTDPLNSSRALRKFWKFLIVKVFEFGDKEFT